MFVCVCHLISDGSESVYLTNCIGQGGCMQACQDFTVAVCHRHYPRHHTVHCFPCCVDAFLQQGGASMQSERRSFQLCHQTVLLLTCVRALIHDSPNYWHSEIGITFCALVLSCLFKFWGRDFLCSNSS